MHVVANIKKIGICHAYVVTNWQLQVLEPRLLARA